MRKATGRARRENGLFFILRIGSKSENVSRVTESRVLNF